MLLLASVALGVVALVTFRRGRPADEALRGQTEAVELAAGGVSVKVPAFITRTYGKAQLVDASAVVGLLAGNPDKGNFIALAVSDADALPFAEARFPSWLSEAYLECLATIETLGGRNWWAVQTNEELPSKPFKLKYIVARNTIPLVSRVCLAGTNGVEPINVRFFGTFSAQNMQRFGEDLQRMFQSLEIDEAVVRRRLRVP